MSNTPHSTDPKIQAYVEKTVRRDRYAAHVFYRVLHLLEQCVAALTIVVLVAALGLEIFHMFTEAGYFNDVEHVLKNLLTIVVGMEFVRMLIDTTPANILEVLTVAITRHVILTHDDPWSNLACVACIAGLFAIRRFLVRRSELKAEMTEAE